MKNNLSYDDIRNKLSPIKNLIALLQHSIECGELSYIDLLEKEIKQSLKSIDYLSGNNTIEKEPIILTEGSKFTIEDGVERTITEVDRDYDHVAYYVEPPFSDGGSVFEKDSLFYDRIINLLQP
jgi:hypothetical protein